MSDALGSIRQIVTANGAEFGNAAGSTDTNTSPTILMIALSGKALEAEHSI
jgi:hypothetical protein